MKIYFILFLVIFSEINPNKWIIRTKFDLEDDTETYNSLELRLGQFTKGTLYSYCETSELQNLIDEIDNYLSSSTNSDFPISSLENLNDALNYSKKIILKEPCTQNEISQEIQEEISNTKSKLSQAFGFKIKQRKIL